MKGFTNKTRIVLRALCALLLALLLIGPEIAQAGTVTIGQGSTRTYTAAAGGESFTVSLTDAYTSVFLQGKPGWVSCTKNGSKFSVEVSKNTGTSSRSGDVVFRDGNKIWTLRITQNGTPAPKKYTVSFNSNGGSSVAAITVTEGGTYGSLPTPTRTGYNFVGWFTAASGGTQITYGTRVTITSNQTLYAHWSAKSFTLSFNSNGGTAVSAKTITYDGTYGTLPAPTRTGYNFVGWFTAVSGGTQITAGTRVTVTSNQTLYAHWSSGTVSWWGVTFGCSLRGAFERRAFRIQMIVMVVPLGGCVHTMAEKRLARLYVRAGLGKASRRRVTPGVDRISRIL